MTSAQIFRISGLALAAGAIAFVVHIVARSAITANADGDTVTFVQESLWAPINIVGVIGAALVLLGLPAFYARIARPIGVLGLVGVVLIALGWMVAGVFVSLYSATVLPWLADTSPSLVDAIEDDTRLLVAFIAGLAAEFVGTILLAIAFLRGGVRPRWAGFVLLASALMTVVGSLMAPNGPASDLTINLLSNLGPVLFLIVLGDRGCQMWFARVPAEHELGRPVGYPAPR